MSLKLFFSMFLCLFLKENKKKFFYLGKYDFWKFFPFESKMETIFKYIIKVSLWEVDFMNLKKENWRNVKKRRCIFGRFLMIFEVDRRMLWYVEDLHKRGLCLYYVTLNSAIFGKFEEFFFAKWRVWGG